MKFEPSQIEKKEFGLSLRGYNQKEVDQFLIEVGKSYRELIEERRVLLGELEKLKKERELHLSREKRIEEALISAQRSAELINESSQERAKLIVKEAEIKAKEVVKKDEEKLKRLDDEIEKLERQKRLFIAKLKSLIETHSELLNFYEEKPEEEKLEKPIKKKVVKKNTSQTGILFEG
ncbi:MAG: DivIVA domain-containing protein [Clostridia bacterium]|jgi:cell division initiation protein|nr:DivIVA domain-containing protein [Clostridia bacterium]